MYFKNNNTLSFLLQSQRKKNLETRNTESKNQNIDKQHFISNTSVEHLAQKFRHLYECHSDKLQVLSYKRAAFSRSHQSLFTTECFLVQNFQYSFLTTRQTHHRYNTTLRK